jgi:hypothetical protein
MKKEIMKQRKINKLSIENRSRGAANSSKKSKSERSYSQQGDEKSGGPTSPRKNNTGVAGMTTGRRNNQNTASLKQQQMDIIDAFLKEYGLINPQFNFGSKPGQPPSGLALFGSRIQKLSELDDEVLSTISKEILRFNSSKKKKEPEVVVD